MANRYRSTRTIPNLRLHREAAGLSQDELASRARMSQSKLSRVERGFLTATPDEREQLAVALGVTVEQLFGCDALRAQVRG